MRESTQNYSHPYKQHPTNHPFLLHPCLKVWRTDIYHLALSLPSWEPQEVHAIRLSVSDVQLTEKRVDQPGIPQRDGQLHEDVFVVNTSFCNTTGTANILYAQLCLTRLQITNIKASSRRKENVMHANCHRNNFISLVTRDPHQHVHTCHEKIINK